ncbi:MAG TPA: GntR family transcriptional regulator [Candidatus Limnocylindrales bacterium]|nr:GntR family transcriptional regulator [Candidatus Limnocylindrales bacterium]
MAGGRGRPLLAEVVRSELKRAILGGEFAVGSKLPNEDRLCDRFGVSRVTVREAVRGLIEEGLVIRKHGSGTYVTRRPLLQNSLDTNFSYTEYIESSGLRAGRKLIGTRTVAATEEIGAILGIPQGAPVVEVRRIRTADRRPAIYSVDLVPAELVGANVGRDELAGSLYRILTAADHPIAHAEAVLSPTIADRDLAGLLDVVPGTPLQFLHQIDFDESGRAVMVSDEWHVPSVMELRVYRRGPGPVA